MPRIARVDENQSEIVDTLREYGYKVAHTHTLGEGKPDIVVGGYNSIYDINELLWVEIKSLGGDLTEDENRFHNEWAGMPVIIAFHARDVMKWFGDKRYLNV